MSESLTPTLRNVAALVDDAMRVGLPEPSTYSITHHTEPTLIMHGFDQVEEWAEYLQTTASRRRPEGTGLEFIDAYADVTDVYGISVRVTTNREIEAGVLA